MRITLNRFEKDNRQKMDTFQSKTAKEVLVSDDFFSLLLHNSLERGYLGEGLPPQALIPPCLKQYNINWLRLDRLPVHPTMANNYDLLGKWQSSLSMMHMLNHRFVFLLQRYRGGTKTNIYLGVFNKSGGTSEAALSQLEHSMQVHMQGITLKSLDEKEENVLYNNIDRTEYAGIMTGIPSLRQSNQANIAQTLDKLACGIGNKNYSLVVVADPVQDPEIAELMQKLLNLQSEIHDSISTTISTGMSESDSRSSSTSGGVSLGKLITGLCIAGSAISLGVAPALATMMSFSGLFANSGSSSNASAISELLGISFHHSRSKSKSYSTSRNVSKQYLNATAKYCEELIQKYIKRLEKGRNLGFWNTGVYVLGENSETIDEVLGVLRSVYAGENTHIEPLRSINCGSNIKVTRCIRNFDFIGIPTNPELRNMLKENVGDDGHWHVLGELFESYTTALNTEELSIATSLPRRDVPGLKYVKNAVKFSSNAPGVAAGKAAMQLGEIYDSGAPTGMEYLLDVNELNRHVFLTGMTGSGKSVTGRRLLNEVMSKDIPILILEPTKTDYVQWAIDYNRQIDETNGDPSKKIAIYMPGAKEFLGTPLEQLKLNLFQPACAEGGKVSLGEHLDLLIAILTSSMPMGDVLPMLLEESVYELAAEIFEEEALSEDVPVESIDSYPDLTQLQTMADYVIKDRNYAAEISNNLRAAMRTRISSLTRGWKNEVFNAEESIPGDELFNRNVVINLDKLSKNSDKSLLMSVIIMMMREYRKSVYMSDTEYREGLSMGDSLQHFTVIEEAHRILSAASMVGENGAARNAIEMFCDVITEIRYLGEGLMVVDQSPAKIVPDVIKNTNVKIIHRIPAKDDRMIVGNCMGLREDQEDMIASLEKGNAIISSEQDDAALWVKVRK